MEKIEKIIRICSNVLLVCAVTFVLLFQGTKLIGLTPYTVISGSMSSVYPIGSVIYVKDVNISELQVGDVITFHKDNAVVTHRIVEVIENGSSVSYQTKGDENDTVDMEEVYEYEVIGQPAFCIPVLGYIAIYLIESPLKYIVIMFALFVLIAQTVFGMMSQKED